MASAFVDRITLQNRLFAHLSRMFGREVPLYDRSLAVNRVCNRAVCDLLATKYPGFSMGDDDIEVASGERHGAIRIGTPEEYRWIGRFFAVFAMHPHNFYDMANIGARSQPIVATAFRSALNPEHRVFTSLLLTGYFDAKTRERIEAVLGQRQVFTDRAKELIERHERQGGLAEADADALINEATQHIFKWTGRARDFALYTELCDAGFKIAADIACFEAHHLNHLTPNTLCMDLYTSAMKRCMGELDDAGFRERAARALRHLDAMADHDHLRLHFRHLDPIVLASLAPAAVAPGAIDALVDQMAGTLGAGEFDLTPYPHAGFKDFTEGPSADTPILLRQDAYKALTEAVEFVNADGSVTKAKHTARFGEIEQRFYATTARGRALYDECLARAEAERAQDPSLARTDSALYESRQAEHFAAFPKTLRGLLEAELVFGRFFATDAGKAAAAIDSIDPFELIDRGLARYEGVRYEDFLPVSAAGIFASNLNQYGTASTAEQRPIVTREDLEQILGVGIIDTDAAYAGMQARSLLEMYQDLGLLDRLGADRVRELQEQAAACPTSADSGARPIATA